MGVAVELQVRTLFMHAWADPQHNLGYKASAIFQAGPVATDIAADPTATG